MPAFWNNKRVLLTGHTGFKGSWLSLMLRQLGAEVSGYALEPVDHPSLFGLCGMDRLMKSEIGDIGDRDRLLKTAAESEAEIILHLAAQPLVRESYADPLETYRVNVLGTATLLDVARTLETVRAIVVVTTDKCYHNNEWHWGYRETDRLGGYDPYSCSKACAELVTDSYRNSFFPVHDYRRHRVALATARAGNVIGGGDRAKDRLIPDAVRAFENDQILIVRSPDAVRPWQHVLDPLRGYLMLAEALYTQGSEFGEAWNFGPADADTQTVSAVMDEFCSLWGDSARWRRDSDASHPHEAGLLKLDCSKAVQVLGWKPMLDFHEALALTVEWHKTVSKEKNALKVTERQIDAYLDLLQRQERTETV